MRSLVDIGAGGRYSSLGLEMQHFRNISAMCPQKTGCRQPASFQQIEDPDPVRGRRTADAGATFTGNQLEETDGNYAFARGTGDGETTVPDLRSRKSKPSYSISRMKNHRSSALSRHGNGLHAPFGRALALLLSAALSCSSAAWGGSVQVMASEAVASQTMTSETQESLTAVNVMGDVVPEQVVAADTSTALYASAGFDYAFSAKKVSLRDVEDRMYADGVITSRRTTQDNSLTLSVSAAESADEEELSQEEERSEEELAEEDRAIEETTLTPVQKKEQSVVNAVSETQNIEIDNATATILAATAVSVVSDTSTAVALAQLADKRQTQAKLDQGVISAVEAEALTAASESTASEELAAAKAQDAAVQNTTVAEDGTLVVETPVESAEEAQDIGEAAGSDADEMTAAQETADAAQDSSAQTQESADSEIATNADGEEIVVANVNDYINIRADASEDAEIVGMLYDGSVAVVLGRTGNGWARIQSGGITGYIREEYVATGSTAAEMAESVATKQAVVTTQTLRVRAAADPYSDVISLIGEGETLDIIEEVDGWYKVSTPDGEGYISSDFADVEQVYPEAVAYVEEEEEEEPAGSASGSGATSSSSGSQSSSGSSGVSLNSYSGQTSSGSSSGSAVANYALQFVGNPYVWGGTSLTNGADCSGFTMAVYANFGVSLPHSSYSQASSGTAVSSLDEAVAGDLIVYDGHVAIYLGNNQIVHASNPTNGICVGTATYRSIVAIRRIFS